MAYPACSYGQTGDEDWENEDQDGILVLVRERQTEVEIRRARGGVRMDDLEKDFLINAMNNWMERALKAEAEVERLKVALNHCRDVMACAETALTMTYRPEIRTDILGALDSGEWLQKRQAIGEAFDPSGRGMAILILRDVQRIAKAAAKEGGE